MLDLDIIRDQQRGILYVLEVNLGGNIWGFSKMLGEKLGSMVGVKNLVFSIQRLGPCRRGIS